jgi:hypothetical protein
MAINPNLISPCGLYCGVCAIYIASRDNNNKLKERLVNLYKGGTPGKGTLPNSDKLSAENIHCGGCLSDDLFMHCQRCEIRSCTKEKGYTGVTSAMISLAIILIIFPWPLAKKSFYGLSRIDENSELKNGFETKRLAIYVQSAVIKFFVAS